MMAAAHHLMAQHVLVMQQMKTSGGDDELDGVAPCLHGKKSRSACKLCREEAAAARKAAKEKGAAGQIEGGGSGAPADQGIKPSSVVQNKKKKESVHSLDEYTRMLNAADFLMREHIKTTKELNTTAQQKLVEKRQMEEMQRQQHEFMLGQMEPAMVEAAELAKIHHQQLLGLRVGPAPGCIDILYPLQEHVPSCIVSASLH